MASKRDRQRKLERARTERRMARQAHKVRQRRQVQAIVGVSVVLILVVLGIIFVVKPFSSNEPQAGACVWVPIDPASNPNVVDPGGTPPSDGNPSTGTEPMTISTNLGDITITLDLDKSACAAASFSFLGTNSFFANSTCNTVSKQFETLTCGDPKSNGTGGPAYQFADEFIPQTPVPDVSLSPTPSTSPSATPNPSASASPVYYTRGQVIMVNTGANTNGSQFMIVYGDHSPITNAHTLVGTVTAGMDIVDKVAAAGAVDDKGTAIPDGKPKTALTFQQVSVGAPGSAPTTSTSPTPAATSPSPAPQS